ncbi:hypothetical protein AU195_21310 [Mycobacterium sp. IS-1496]|uniref:hypothetical protein n=1 Tax=Mycobacterium sp. IS-1496 TaxID=1772284 RepID=UPI0007415465|nr:hypothetical protein [Mycobacterium sp. IS-1496]KUI28841.1 hypothetical protein AU195_21310 [Mycobacterium sp. IS-1496]
MIRSRMRKTVALATGAMALPVGVALAAAAPASAGPDVCVSGPYGVAYACVDTPGWVQWYDDGPRGRGNGHWKHGHHNH